MRRYLRPRSAVSTQTRTRHCTLSIGCCRPGEDSRVLPFRLLDGIDKTVRESFSIGDKDIALLEQCGLVCMSSLQRRHSKDRSFS